MKTYLSKSSLAFALCATALLLGSRWCCAASCPDTAEVTIISSTEDKLADQFQPGDGATLYRYRFAPDPFTYGTGPYPTAVLIAPDEFKDQYNDMGVPGERLATADLQLAGFLVFQIEHRLAPPGLLNTQPPHAANPASGRPPEQTDDVKQEILAALADSQCNQKIYLVGGSAGGCHALWVALDSTSGAVTNWNDTVRQKIKAVVSLSGVTDLGDWSDYDMGVVDIGHFADVEVNYTNSGTYSLTNNPYPVLEAASPITLVSSATSCPPMLLYATQGDPVPHQQAENMQAALSAKFSTVKIDERTIKDGDLHAFDYWHAQDTTIMPHDCVSRQVISFLQNYL
jgi:acetyl esterase/lipase